MVAADALGDPVWRDLVRGVGLLRVRFESTIATATCTAWVVAPHALMTAGHCIQLRGTDKRPTYWTYDPADSSVPPLTGPVLPLVRHADSDYVILYVPEAITVPPLPIHPGDVGAHEPLALIRNFNDRAIVVTRGPCRVVELEGLRSFTHDCTTNDGSSGAPVLAIRGMKYEVVGLHNAGSSEYSNEAVNLGRVVREDAAVAAIIRGELPPDLPRAREPGLSPTAVASSAVVAPSSSVERTFVTPSISDLSEPYRRLTPPTTSREPQPVRPSPATPFPSVTPTPAAGQQPVYSPIAPQLVGASLPEPVASDRGATVSVQLLGFVGGALRDPDGLDGRVSFGGALRVDVAIDRVSPAFIVGAMGGGGADSVGWGEGTVSWGPVRSFRIGAGVGAATFDARIDPIVSAHALIAAPIFPGYRQFVGLLGAEIMKGLSTSFVYNHYSLGVGAVF